ncbi:DUF84 family protein [Patescibacteria group bacterium]|nr:DUF84 family protein [Patescibacteria group bacterium]MBU1721366.1 DUF84 family protein [Patescibacteria group bacterium]
MKIIIATENKAKIKAIEEVLALLWNDIELIGEKFSSEVKEQPLTEEEGIQGALNRAKNAKEKYPDADFCIGMEGYVDSNDFGMFLGGAVVIVDKKGNTGIGMSAKMQLPNSIENCIHEGEELGPLVKSLMNDSSDRIRHYDGTNGILSKGLYNRVDEFKDATKCALCRFVSPEFFEEYKS